LGSVEDYYGLIIKCPPHAYISGPWSFPLSVLCFLCTLSWRTSSTSCSYCHIVLSKLMGPRNHEMNPLKLWAKRNISSFKLFSQVFWSQLCKSNHYTILSKVTIYHHSHSPLKTYLYFPIFLCYFSLQCFTHHFITIVFSHLVYFLRLYTFPQTTWG
jgi:hypothetical protein